MRHSFLKMATLAFIALGFVACESDSVGGIKKPLVYKNFDKQLKPYYVIQSQDENTIIEDYVVNRGNCGDKGLQKYVLNDEYNKAKEFVFDVGDWAVTSKFCVDNKNKEVCKVAKADPLSPFEQHHKDRKVGNFKYFLDKQGNKVEHIEEIYSSNIDFYNNLHDDFKKFYKKAEHKLGFGKSMAVKTKCSADRIMEIEITLNGGKKATYTFDPQYGGF